MNRDHWNKLNDIFNQASNLRIDGREAFLKRACGSDARLLQEVIGLLGRADSMTDELLLGPAALNARECIPQPEFRDPLMGINIGPYQLEERIGHGGFATVYLASRTVGFEQDVAIKLLREDREFGETVIRRFEIERQILSDLRHENIACLLDGGRTESGRPYFVMEYVNGRSITEYCNENRLSVPKRLEVFQQVCRAVAHAHQYGIVHRDIKPSNILVTDGGVPKLLDFGIAKITDVPAGEPSAGLTLTGQLPLTPEYASPEHVRGDAVGLASDVYSLGVVLYELLAGRHPYVFGAQTQSEVERVVCQREPDKPSTIVLETRVAKAAKDTFVTKGIDVETISAARSTEPGRLCRLLRGDLDNIVLMAMRKEPDRRYASARQLADDIQRYFDGLHVIAREESVAYRIQKFILRNRSAVVAASLVVLALIVGCASTTLLWLRAKGLAEENQRQLYVSDMQLAIESLTERRMGQVRGIIKRHVPLATGKDVRGLEWHLLHSLSSQPVPTVLQGHEGSVREVAAIPNRPWIASVSHDETIRIWNYETGKVIATFLSSDGPLEAVAVSPDGRLVAAGNQFVTVRDVLEKRELYKLARQPATVESLAFSPDGKVLAVGARYESVSVFSVEDGKLMQQRQNDSRHDQLTFTDDGRNLICSVKGEPYFLRLWDSRLQRMTGKIRSNTAHARLMDVSRDGNWLVAASEYDTRFHFFEVTSGKLLHSVHMPGDRVRCIALNPDDSRVVTGHYDGSIRYWHIKTVPAASSDSLSFDIRPEGHFRADMTCVRYLAFTADGRLITCGDDHTVKIWPRIWNRGFQVASTEIGLGPIAVSKDGVRIATVTRNGELFVRIRKNDTWARVTDAGIAGRFNSISMSGDGKYLAAATEQGQIVLIALADLSVKGVVSFAENRNVNSIDFSPDSRLLAATGNDNKTCVWQVRGLRQLYRFPHSERGTAVVFSPDGKDVACAGSFRQVQIYNLRNGARVHTLETEKELESLAWAPFTSKLAIGSSDGSITLWDTRRREIQARMLGHQNGVSQLIFSQDGNTLISLSKFDGTLRLWHTPSGREIGILYDRTDSFGIDGDCVLSDLALTEDGKTLYASAWVAPESDASWGSLLKWTWRGIENAESD